VIRIVVADDHPGYRARVVRLLERHGLRVVGVAVDGEQALALIHELHPDVALLDLRMPRLSGADVARRVAGAGEGVAVLVVSAYGEPEVVDHVLASGAAGFVHKDAAAADLVAAVRRLGCVAGPPPAA
jgi:DNA-binding NarL/FixJ family response regulator